MVDDMTHYTIEREADELQQKIVELDAELKRNIEQNAMLHKERAALKRELWELKDE